MAKDTQESLQAANGKKVRKVLTEAEKAVRDATNRQRAILGMIGNAQKACQISRAKVAKGESPSREVLVACGTLSQALAAMLVDA